MYKNLLVCFVFLCVFRLDAANYYWIGGNGNWSDLSHWRLGSPTGSIPSIVPSATDNVFFGSYSGFIAASRTVTLDANAYCNNMTWESDVPNNPILARTGSNTLFIYSNLVLAPTVTYEDVVDVEFAGNNPGTLTTNGPIADILNLEINKPGSGLTLMDDLIYTVGGTILNQYGLTLTAGYLDASDKNVAVYSFWSENSNPRHLDITGGRLSVLRNFYFRGTNKTIAAAASYVQVGIRLVTDGGEFDEVEAMSDSPNNDLFSVYNTTFRKLTFSHPSATSNARIHANNTVDSLIFMGQGVVRAGNNTIEHLSIAGNATIGGANNIIQYAEIGGTTDFIENGGHVIDTLLTAPNKNIYVTRTITINKYFRAGGEPCDGFTEITGYSGGTIHFADGAEIEIDNVLLTGLSATGSMTPLTVNGIDNEGNNGFIFNTPLATTRTLYWVGGAGDWNDRSHWSESSGGSGGACIPFIGDDVVFDGNSGLNTGGTVATSGNTYCHDMTWAASITGNPVFAVNGNFLMQVYGSLAMHPDVTMNARLDMRGAEEVTVETNGNQVGNNRILVRKEAAGGVTLLDDWDNPSGIFQLNVGYLDIAGRTVNINIFTSNTNGNRYVNMQDADITVGRWEYRGNNKTLDADNSHLSIGTSVYMANVLLQYDEVEISSGSLNEDNFLIDGAGFRKLTFSNPSLTTVARIGANNVIERLEFKGQGAIAGTGNMIDSVITGENRNFWLGSATTNTINEYFKAVHPDCSGLGEIRSLGSSSTVVFGADAEVEIANVYMENIVATGGGGTLTLPITFSGADAGGNAGWNIVASDGDARYWVGGAGDWNDASHWSTISGGPGGACIPTVANDVYFDGNSGFGTTVAARTITVNTGNAYFHDMSWVGVMNNPILNKVGPWNIEAWGESMVLNPLSTLNTIIQFRGAEETTITGQALGNLDFELRKLGGRLILANNYTNTQTDIFLYEGVLAANNVLLNIRSIDNDERNNNLSIDISGSTINATAHWRYNGGTSNRSLNAAGSTISANQFLAAGFVYDQVSINGTAAAHGAFSDVTASKIVFTDPSVASQIGINGANNQLDTVEFKGGGGIYGTGNTIGTLIFFPGSRYTFNAGTNTTITGDWFGSGTPCRLTEIVSSAVTNATVTKATGSVDFDYVRFQRMTATGGAEFTAGSHSQDLGGSSGWDIAPYDGASPIAGLGPDISRNENQFPYTLYTDGFFGHPESQYEWSRDGAVIGTDDNLIVTEPGTYAVTVTFPDGCSINDEIVITREEADIETVKATKEVGRTTYTPGEEAMYTITVTNNGPYAALDVEIADVAPEGTTITAWIATVTAGVVDLPNENGTGDLAETIADLPVGAIVVYEVTLSTGSGMEADLVNTAMVSSITPDPEPECGTCAVTLIATPVADLSVTKTLTDDTQVGYVPGDAVAYTITASNEGPSDASNVRIEDMAPEGVNITVWTASVGEGTVNLPNGSGSGDLDETLTVLPSGATVIYEITVQTPADFRDDLINTASVSSDTEDPDEENNTATTPALPSVPDAPVSDGDLEACAEDPVQTFTALATVQDGAVIVWYDSPIGGNTVADPSLDTVGTVTYYAEAVKDGLSSETRTAVILTIHALPLVVINDPDVVCLPGTVDLTAAGVTAGSDAGLVFTYYTDAAGTTDLANPEAVSQSGTYYIGGTVPTTGCRTVMPIVVRFVERPEVSVIHPSCIEGTGSIEVTSPIGAGFEYSIDGVNYQSDTEFADLAPGTYEVTSRHTDVTGCVSDPLEVTISSNPVTETPQVIQPDCVENRGSMVFQYHPEYEYSIDNGVNYQLSPNFTNLEGGTYLARVRRPSAGCEAEAVEVIINEEIILPNAPVSDGDKEACSTDSSLPLVATVTVPGGVTVVWYDAMSGGNTIDSPVWNQVGSVTYYAEAHKDSCVGTERTPVTLTIRVSPLPDPVEDVEYCGVYILPGITGNDLSGDEAYYTGAGGTGDRYLPGEVITELGTMTLYVYDRMADGCTGETSFQLTVNEMLPGSIGTDQTIRNNEVPEFIQSENAGTGVGSIIYRWEMSEDGSSWLSVDGANGETYQPGVLTATTHYRRITVATMGGGTVCESEPTAQVTVTVMDADAPVANDDMVSTLMDTPVTFNPLDNDVEGGFSIDPTSVKLIDPDTGEGVIFLDIMGEGTWEVDPNTGEVTFIPEAGFNGETSAIGYIMYDEVGTESNPALLIVRIAEVPEAEGVTVHNVISPNGDGANDYLIIKGIESYPNNKLEIYNRWGVQVFKAEGYNNSGKVFDGTSDARITLKKSNGMPAGTYYYVLRYNMDGNMQSKAGWIYIQNNN